MIDGNKEGWQEPANTLNNPIPNNNVTHFICDVNNKNIGLPDGQSLTSDEWQSVFSAWQHWGLIGNDAVNSDTSLDTIGITLADFYKENSRYKEVSKVSVKDIPFRIRHKRGWDCGRGYVVKCWDTKENKICYFYVPCNKRTCSACQKRLSWHIYQRLKPTIRTILNHSQDNMKLRLMTLTLSNSDDKYENVQFFKQALHRLWWRLQKKGLKKRYNVQAMVGAFEFGSKNLNLHFHSVILSKYIPQKELSDLWSDVTGGRGKIVDIRNITGLKGVKEVLKYASKLDNLSNGQKEIIELALKGSRRIIIKGLFYKLTKGLLKDENEDLKKILQNKRYIFMDIMTLDWFLYEHKLTKDDIFEYEDTS